MRPALEPVLRSVLAPVLTILGPAKCPKLFPQKHVCSSKRVKIGLGTSLGTNLETGLDTVPGSICALAFRQQLANRGFFIAFGFSQGRTRFGRVEAHLEQALIFRVVRVPACEKIEHRKKKSAESGRGGGV